MPLHIMLVPAPSSRRRFPRITNRRAPLGRRLFQSSAIASAGAVAVYAVLALALAWLSPTIAPVIISYPPLDPRSPMREPDVARPEASPPAPPPHVSDPVIEPAEGVIAPTREEPPERVPDLPGGEAGLLAPDAGPAAPGLRSDPQAGHASESAVATYYEEAPEVMYRSKPPYPQFARDAGVSGTVLLHVLVGLDGIVEDVRVLQSIPLLDESAVRAARQWIFTPARVSGRPVRVWVALPMRFSLH